MDSIDKSINLLIESDDDEEFDMIVGGTEEELEDEELEAEEMSEADLATRKAASYKEAEELAAKLYDELVHQHGAQSMTILPVGVSAELTKENLARRIKHLPKTLKVDLLALINNGWELADIEDILNVAFEVSEYEGAPPEYDKAGMYESWKLDKSNQADDHYAFYVDGDKVITTTAGWDGPEKLAEWTDKGIPEPISRNAAMKKLVKLGVPESVVQGYIKKMGRDVAELAESEDIKAMYRKAGMKPPKGKGIHTKKFHRCVTQVGKKGKVDNPYAVCMSSMGRDAAVKKSHQRSEGVEKAVSMLLGESIIKEAKRPYERVNVKNTTPDAYLGWSVFVDDKKVASGLSQRQAEIRMQKEIDKMGGVR